MYNVCSESVYMHSLSIWSMLKKNNETKPVFTKTQMNNE